MAEIIRRESTDAEVVMLGLATPEKGKETEAAQRMEGLSEGLPNVFFVKNASLFIGDLVTPEVEEEPESEQETPEEKED